MCNEFDLILLEVDENNRTKVRFVFLKLIIEFKESNLFFGHLIIHFFPFANIKYMSKSLW